MATKAQWKGFIKEVGLGLSTIAALRLHSIPEEELQKRLDEHPNFTSRYNKAKASAEKKAIDIYLTIMDKGQDNHRIIATKEYIAYLREDIEALSDPMDM